MTSEKSDRYKLFISYSHKDKKWLERVRIHLRPLERDHDIEIWDDTKIQAGSDWGKEIKNAIKEAKVALLLVSADFIASDFIANNELPPLLEAAKNDGACVIPLLLKPSRFTYTKSISMYQAVNSPENTLTDVNESEQEKILVNMTIAVESALKKSNQQEGLLTLGGRRISPKEDTLCLPRDSETLKQLLALGDSHTEIINFQSYVDRIIYDFENWQEYCDGQRKPIIELFERANLYKYYVNLRCRDAEKEYDPIDRYIEDWINKDDKNHIILLGDYGTGKSSFLLYLTYLLAKSFKSDPINIPIPIFISLKNFKKIKNIKKLIKEVMRDDYNITLPPSFDFQHSIEEGTIVLLLDGFDEMESKSNKDIILHNFDEINKLVTRKSKVILTSRTHYFKTHSQVNDIFNPQYDTELLKMIRGNPRFEVLELLEFNYGQIIEFLERHTDKYMEMWRKIKSTYNLDDLSKRPILLEMIIRTLPKILDDGGEINASRLYEVYTDIWIRREDWRSVMDPDEKEIFMIELALHMFINNIQSVHFTELNQIVLNHFKRKIISSRDADVFYTDTMTCSFLNRDKSGNYKFIHKSFMEFFVAKKFYDEILNNNIVLFKERPLPPEIINFMSKMDIEKDQLYDAVYSTSNQIFEQVKYMGGNAISILNYMGETFTNRNFSNTILRNADFEGAVCDNSSFLNAELHDSSFIDSSLLYVNLEGATLEGSLIDGIGHITSIGLDKKEDKLAFGTINGCVSVIDLKNYRKIFGCKETNLSIEKIRFFGDDQFIGFSDSNKQIFIFDTIFFDRYDIEYTRQETVVGIDFDPSNPDIAILYSNHTIEIFNITSRNKRTIDLRDKNWYGNDYDISYLDDSNSIAIISNKKINIIDVKNGVSIKSIRINLDHIDGVDYKPDEDALYIYQNNKLDIKMKGCSYGIDYEIVNLKEIKSEIIKIESMALVSRKDNLMLSIEFNDQNTVPIFKIINLEPCEVLFSWENIPGPDSHLLLNFLEYEYDFNLKNTEYNKSSDGKSISVFNYEKIINIPINGNEDIIDDAKLFRKIKLTIEGDELTIFGKNYYYYRGDIDGNRFEDVLYNVKDFKKIQGGVIHKDSRKLLNYLGINTGYEAIYKSSDGKAIFICRERHAEMIIDEQNERASLKLSNGKDQDMKIKRDEDGLKVYKIILKESYNNSLILEKSTKYRPPMVFSKDSDSVYISDHSGNLILWNWKKELNLKEKEGHIWNKYNNLRSKTMLEMRFINQNLFKCNYMTLCNTSGINTEKIQALTRIGAVVKESSNHSLK